MSKNSAALLALITCILPVSTVHGRNIPEGGVVQLSRVTSFTATPYGIDLWDGQARMRIIALREDVVRVRVSRSGTFAEDASWAILPESEQSRRTVTPTVTPDAVGFQTDALRVSIDRQ